MANEINNVITQFIHEHMYMHIVLIALSVAVMLLAMAVDFSQACRKPVATEWPGRRRG